jgi:hypothetical protein
VLDHRQGDLDLLAGGGREIERGEPLAGVAPVQTATVSLTPWWKSTAWMRCSHSVR